MLTFVDWLAALNGIAHSSDARAAGYGRHIVSDAVAAGLATRVRRSWLILPSVDPRRRAAATLGGRVTCLSAAALYGLWTPPHEGTHIAVSPNASAKPRAGAVLHWSTGPVPIGTHLIDDPLLNALRHVARCVPHVHAMTVWESAVRLGHVTQDQLIRTRWSSERAEAVAHATGLLSDAGTETTFIALMRAIGVTVVQQARIDGHRVDALIGRRLIVQIDGFAHHSSPHDRRRDIRADARLSLLGYTVLRFDYQQVMFDPAFVQSTVQFAIAQGLDRVR